MVFAKYFSLSDVAVIPEWTPFYKTMSFKLNFPTIIGNCRSYPASPTSIANVYTDEAVYQIFKEIQWKTKNEFENMLFRLGGFHIAKNFLGVIGKRMDGSGYWKARHRMVSPRLKVMCNLSFSRELLFFFGHHPHCLSIIE